MTALAARKISNFSIKSYFKLAEGLCLNLTCVLQLSNPVRLFFFQACHLGLNLNSSLVFFVDATDEIQFLLLSF